MIVCQKRCPKGLVAAQGVSPERRLTTTGKALLCVPYFRSRAVLGVSCGRREASALVQALTPISDTESIDSTLARSRFAIKSRGVARQSPFGTQDGRKASQSCEARRWHIRKGAWSEPSSDPCVARAVSRRSRSDRSCKGTLRVNEQNIDSKDRDVQLLSRLKAQELSIVNPRRKNGLIIYKTYHAEFAGPGAIVGGQFDVGAVKVLAVGNISLISPQDSQSRKQAYKMRRQWVKLTKQIIDNPQPTQRAQVILNQFEHWFDAETVAELPDEAFALLVGVLPQTIRKVRNTQLL